MQHSNGALAKYMLLQVHQMWAAQNGALMNGAKGFSGMQGWGRAPSHTSVSCSLSGKLALQAIEAFQKDPPTTVFLPSMRSGAVGINLTAANHVFLMEPAFNPALEDQAVGRAHRMGQTRPVTVGKFYIKARSCSARSNMMSKHQ